MMPTPLAFRLRIRPKSFSTSLSSREEVGSSRIRTLHSMSTALAMAIICWTAMEQPDSCILALAGMSRDSRILLVSRFICPQLRVAF